MMRERFRFERSHSFVPNFSGSHPAHGRIFSITAFFFSLSSGGATFCKRAPTTTSEEPILFFFEKKRSRKEMSDHYDVGRLVVAVCLFAVAGVCEIGGGWLAWKWRREGWGWYSLVAGGVLLVLYGIIPTLQREPFGRTYAAYGGFFIALSLFWGWAFDSFVPDRWDLIGSAMAVAGVCLVMFAPRRNH